MRDYITITDDWRIFRLDASWEWCLLVRRGIAIDMHDDIISYFISNCPDPEEVKAEIEEQRESLVDMIGTFIKHIHAVRQGWGRHDYIDNIGLLFYQLLLKTILEPASKRWLKKNDPCPVPDQLPKTGSLTIE